MTKAAYKLCTAHYRPFFIRKSAYAGACLTFRTSPGAFGREEDEGAARTAYEEFRHRWSIDYPLLSVEIRHSSYAFSWLKRGADEYEKFMRDLSRFLTTIEVVGLACANDTGCRPVSLAVGNCRLR